MEDIQIEWMSDEQKPVRHDVIAGALFDFMGYLTSRKERIVLSSTDEASPAVDAIRDFAKMRGLSLDDAKVQDWYTHPHPAVVKQLVEAAESALEAMQSVAVEAYQRAEPVCCGRGGNECCGCPEPKWNSVDEVILLRLHHPQQELTAALSAAKEVGYV